MPDPTQQPPPVSVVIAAYRADNFLEHAVRDASTQTYPNVEVIVSDDADARETRAVVERAGGPRVTYRSNSMRLGVAGNHWAALRAAHGTWVAILNHDDRWDPTFLSRMMAAVGHHPDSVVGFCDHHVIDSDGQRHQDQADALAAHYQRNRLSPGRQPSLPALVVRQTIPLAMGAVFKMAAIKLDDLPDRAGPAYDLWLAYLLARSDGSAVYVPERLTSWRQHPQNQTSASGRDWVAGAAACWSAMAADPAFSEMRSVVRRKAAEAEAALATVCLRDEYTREARAAARSSLLYRPTAWRPVAVLALSTLPSALGRRLVNLRQFLKYGIRFS